MGKIKFGTDGWRALIAEDYTFENVRICAQATARYLQESKTAHKGIVIGYDTRFASEAERVREFVRRGGGCRATYFNHAKRLRGSIRAGAGPENA